MKVQSTEFGVYQGKVVNAFTLINDNGMKVTLLSLGGIIHDIQVPDRAGQLHACVRVSVPSCYIPSALHNLYFGLRPWPPVVSS